MVRCFCRRRFFLCFFKPIIFHCAFRGFDTLITLSFVVVTAIAIAAAVAAVRYRRRRCRQMFSFIELVLALDCCFQTQYIYIYIYSHMLACLLYAVRCSAMQCIHNSSVDPFLVPITNSPYAVSVCIKLTISFNGKRQQISIKSNDQTRENSEVHDEPMSEWDANSLVCILCCFVLAWIPKKKHIFYRRDLLNKQ